MRLLPLMMAVAVGLAGCHGEIQSQLSNNLITFSDKFLDVAHVKDKTFVVVGHKGRILRTEDAGKTWQEILPRPTEFSLNQVEFAGDAGWAVGHAGTILHSRDAGKSWQKQQIDTDKTMFSVSFVDNLHGWASGDESTFVRTDNGGETWTVEHIEVSEVGLSEETRAAVPDLIYYGVDFVDQQNGWMVGEYGNIRHTADGGKTWDSQHGSLLDSMAAPGQSKDVMLMGAWSHVSFSDVSNGMVVGASGSIAVTEDGGKVWRWVSREGSKADVPSIHLYDVARNAADGRLTAVGANGTILTSTNNGADWQPAKVLFGVFTWINGIEMANGSPEGVMVGGRGLLLLTNDGGQTWRPISG
jgi:photosystem II stability/assembly factor-like uncharacterized protein